MIFAAFLYLCLDFLQIFSLLISARDIPHAPLGFPDGNFRCGHMLLGVFEAVYG